MPFTKWVRTCEEGEQKWQNYLNTLNSMTPKELIEEFFSYLDYTEVRGQEDREVHPISISCGRVMMHEPLAEVLKRMREYSNA